MVLNRQIGQRCEQIQMMQRSLLIAVISPHYQQSCPPCLTYPSGGPTMNDEIAL